MVAINRRDVDVVSPVVVIIGNGHAHPVHFHVESAARRYVRERPVVIVAVQRAQSLLRVRPKGVAIDEQQIGPAVAINMTALTVVGP